MNIIDCKQITEKATGENRKNTFMCVCVLCVCVCGVCVCGVCVVQEVEKEKK